MIRDLDPAALAAWQADAQREAPVIVDVREPWEVGICAIGGSLFIPLAELPARYGELPADRDLVLVCHHGIRSHVAALLLQRDGFGRVHNLRGGIAAWAAQVDPAMPSY